MRASFCRCSYGDWFTQQVTTCAGSTFPASTTPSARGPTGSSKRIRRRHGFPPGKSFWEFGVNKDPQAKAEKDYAARRQVSARRRAGGRDVRLRDAPQLAGQGGVAQRRRTPWKEWKAVRVLDASDLEQWLEESIPAQIWLAEKLGMPTTGHETLDVAGSAGPPAANRA